jgi:hypothetical protein
LTNTKCCVQSAPVALRFFELAFCMAHPLALDSIELSVNGHSEFTVYDYYEPTRISSGC